MGRRTNGLYNPFEELPPCLCPKCYKPSLAINEIDHVMYSLDENGIPENGVCDTTRVFVCLECGFTSTKFIPTDKGWRYNPYHDDEYLINKNKISKPYMVDGNPLVKEG